MEAETISSFLVLFSVGFKLEYLLLDAAKDESLDFAEVDCLDAATVDSLDAARIESFSGTRLSPA
jgi:hypothetical protein